MLRFRMQIGENRDTGIYGHIEASQKKHTQTLFRRLAGLSSRLDFFREILNLNEKSRGLDRDVRMISYQKL